LDAYGRRRTAFRSDTTLVRYNDVVRVEWTASAGPQRRTPHELMLPAAASGRSDEMTKKGGSFMLPQVSLPTDGSRHLLHHRRLNLCRAATAAAGRSIAIIFGQMTNDFSGAPPGDELVRPAVQRRADHPPSDDLERIREGLGDKTSVVIQAFSGFIAGFVIGFIKSWKMTLVMMSLTPLLAISVIQGAGMGFVMFVLFSAYCLAFWFGATQDTLGATGLPPGDIFTVFFCVLIGSFSIGLAGQPFSQVVAAQGAAATIFAIIDRKPTIDVDSETGDKPAHCTGQIELRDVDHSKYPTRPDVRCCRGVFLYHPAPARRCPNRPLRLWPIVKLILRFYDPESGTVLIDAARHRELNAALVQKAASGWVSQEPVPVQRFHQRKHPHAPEEVTDEEMVASLQAGQTRTKFISRLPNGIRHSVWRAGRPAQRRPETAGAIARALVRRPDILLLDEATSGVGRRKRKSV
uniref:ABC transmembrane type-1 domain-containing protein n=1 Tax=Macrostomum lignano TaxID=282301 RepID=A0A1I8FQI8_9PLAT